MNLFFILFVVFGLLLVLNSVKAFRAKQTTNGVVSLLAAIAVIAIGHFMFNF